MKDGRLRASDLRQQKWREEKRALIALDLQMNHSADFPTTDKGNYAQAKLAKLRAKMLADDPYLMQRPYVERRDTLVNSELFEAFKEMPKPAIHHSHVTAASSVEFLIKLTYYHIVYYSETDNLFFVSKNGCTKPGYVECIKLR